MFYAIISYQFNTSELKNVRKLIKQQLKPESLVRIDWECAFLLHLKTKCGP